MGDAFKALPPVLSRNKERGFALISVLWLLALLAVFAAGMTALVRTDTLVARSLVNEAQAEGWANAGVYYVVNGLAEERLLADLAFDGRTGVIQIAEQAVTVSVQDEAGKIDINFAAPEIIASLLVKAGVPDAKAAKIVFALEKRRDALMKAPADKAAVKLAFRTPEEMKRLPGMTEEIFTHIRQAITVYSQSPTPYMATAPRLVLQSLPDLDPVTIEAILAERQKKKTTPAGDRAARAGKTERKSRFAGKTFAIESVAIIGKSAFKRTAVVRITDDSHKPFWILNWSTADIENSVERKAQTPQF